MSKGLEALEKLGEMTLESEYGDEPKVKGLVLYETIEKDKCTEICLRNKKWWIQENDFLLKDYGKTWAFTKEELEDENNENRLV